MNISDFVIELSKLRKSSTILCLHKYKSQNGEIADFMLSFHISYENALKKSLEIVKNYVPSDPLHETAKEQIISSFESSLEKIRTTEIEEIDDAYERFFDDDGRYIKGVKLHRDTECVHLYGLLREKRVIVQGTYKNVNSRPLTIAKRDIEKLCPVSKFRQFKITPSQVEKIKVEKLELTAPEGWN